MEYIIANRSVECSVGDGGERFGEMIKVAVKAESLDKEASAIAEVIERFVMNNNRGSSVRKQGNVEFYDDVPPGKFSLKPAVSYTAVSDALALLSQRLPERVPYNILKREVHEMMAECKGTQR